MEERTNNYFEENKAEFLMETCVIEETAQTYGLARAKFFNNQSTEETDIELHTYNEKSDEWSGVFLSPMEAYWLGKTLIDFAENAVRLNNLYNQENKADE